MTATIHERWKAYRTLALPGLKECSLVEQRYKDAFFSGCLAALELSVFAQANPQSPSPADVDAIWRLRQELRNYFTEATVQAPHPAIRQSNGDH